MAQSRKRRYNLVQASQLILTENGDESPQKLSDNEDSNELDDPDFDFVAAADSDSGEELPNGKKKNTLNCLFHNSGVGTYLRVVGGLEGPERSQGLRRRCYVWPGSRARLWALEALDI